MAALPLVLLAVVGAASLLVPAAAVYHPFGTAHSTTSGCGGSTDTPTTSPDNTATASDGPGENDTGEIDDGGNDTGEVGDSCSASGS